MSDFVKTMPQKEKGSDDTIIDTDTGLSLGDRDSNSSGKDLANLEEHQGLVYVVTFISNGKLLASGSGDKITKRWDLQGKIELANSDRVYELELFCRISSR